MSERSGDDPESVELSDMGAVFLRAEGGGGGWREGRGWDGRGKGRGRDGEGLGGKGGGVEAKVYETPALDRPSPSVQSPLRSLLPLRLLPSPVSIASTTHGN